LRVRAEGLRQESDALCRLALLDVDASDPDLRLVRVRIELELFQALCERFVELRVTEVEVREREPDSCFARAGVDRGPKFRFRFRLALRSEGLALDQVSRAGVW